MLSRFMGAGLLVAATLGLGACSTYDRYGYSDVRVGVNYGSPYYGSRYARSGYYGWYDNFYYPGTGYYVYDRRGARHRWSSRHRDYWIARRSTGRSYRDNWSGYNVSRHYRDQRRDRDRYERRDRYDREDRYERRDQRRDRRDDRRHDRRDRRQDRDRSRARDDRRGNRRDDRRRRGRDD